MPRHHPDTAMILVTGATGFVGRYLVRDLVAQGRSVRILSRARERAAGIDAAVEVVIGDPGDDATARRALQGVLTIVHLAAALPVSAAADAACSANESLTRTLARAARASGVRNFVHVSSAGVYGDGATMRPHTEGGPTAPRTPYERSKLDAERAVAEELAGSGVARVVLRPSGIHGPGRAATLNWYREIARRRVWLHGPVEVIVHPADVDDAVQAIVSCIDRGDLDGEVINVAGARALPYQALIHLVAARINPSLVQAKAPSWPVRPIAAALRSAALRMGVPVPNAIERSSKRIINRSVDIAKARALLNFAPVPLETSIERTADWFLALRA